MKLNKRKKILLISQGSGKWYTSIDDSYIRAFKKLEIDLDVYNLNFSIPSIFYRILVKTKFLYENSVDILNNILLKNIRTKKYDIIFVIKGFFLKPWALQEMRIRFPDTIISCFNPDDPFNVNGSSSNKNILESIPHYHQYYTYSKNLCGKINNNYSNKAFHLPFAADTDIIYPFNDAMNKEYEFSFIANADTERKLFIDKISKELLRRHLDLSIKVFGNYWHNGKNIIKYPHISGLSFLKVIGKSKINLNILRLQNKYSQNMRTFEIPAAKGFMLHENSEEAKSLFIEDIETIYFSTAEECVDKVNYYLRNESQIEKVALNGYEKIIKADYTYIARARQILEYVNNY